MQFIQTIYFDSFKHAIEYVVIGIYLPQAYLHKFIANVANLCLIQTIYLAGAYRMSYSIPYNKICWLFNSLQQNLL
jgi:hypothetical protein